MEAGPISFQVSNLELSLQFNPGFHLFFLVCVTKYIWEFAEIGITYSEMIVWSVN